MLYLGLGGLVTNGCSPTGLPSIIPNVFDSIDQCTFTVLYDLPKACKSVRNSNTLARSSDKGFARFPTHQFAQLCQADSYADAVLTRLPAKSSSTTVAESPRPWSCLRIVSRRLDVTHWLS
ncbi:hypothetical protein OUZ56_010162 [Daphnia magna]|uniref:Uncharacterized protein n=1 Tax=Daphnia magna TaxID=35525 RepID=A0ABR0AHY8_9CRUS|nr:hypothetical protein OUZ56_010162 [Daphnia magna]